MTILLWGDLHLENNITVKLSNYTIGKYDSSSKQRKAKKLATPHFFASQLPLKNEPTQYQGSFGRLYLKIRILY